jgi:hypothetical protein
VAAVQAAVARVVAPPLAVRLPAGTAAADTEAAHAAVVRAAAGTVAGKVAAYARVARMAVSLAAPGLDIGTAVVGISSGDPVITSRPIAAGYACV